MSLETVERRTRAGRTPPDGADSAGLAAPAAIRATGPSAPTRSPPETVGAAPEPDRPAFDRLLRARLMRLALGRSPMSVAMAFHDWAGHLALSPARQVELARLAAESWLRLAAHASAAPRAGADAPPPYPGDRRFADPAWRQAPFDLLHQSFLAIQDWWRAAATGVPGVSKHHADIVDFTIRQSLDMLSPANLAFTNPVALARAAQTQGQSLLRGFGNLADDTRRVATGQPPPGTERFVVGRDVATAKGQVVFRNELIELIQYAPTTATVHPEPVLIVPAWIMKYYILDLSPENSLVRFLVARGFTVFMISWRNPRPAQRDLGMDDYLDRGVCAAREAVAAIVPDHPMHAVGYCLGGTLLAIAAAAAAIPGGCDPGLKTLSLIAAQTDFAEAGELTLFIDESAVTFIEDLMWEQGVLDESQMAGAFQMLRSNDLIWSRVSRDYLTGERAPLTDVMAWNADATHMPARMHGEYLRRLFLDNAFAAGRYLVGGKPATLSNIKAPMFVLGTEWDHVAPWRSVYRVHLQADTDIVFALTSGGHNMGVVNPPPGERRHFRVGMHRHDETYVGPDDWLAAHAPVAGSWWTAFADWLGDHSSPRAAPPPVGAPGKGFAALCAAPGTYVHDA